MPFFDPVPGRGNFMVHFTFPDFRIWALGYTHAAQVLKRSLLARLRFSDYEAYPLVFLYRHALELHLKNIIARSADLAAMHGEPEIIERLRITHQLPVLSALVRRLLERRDPDDPLVADTLRRLDSVVTDLHSIDPSSMNFRYPLNTIGDQPTGPLDLSVRALAGGLDTLLDELDTIGYAMAAELEQAEEAFQLLYESGI